MTAQEIKNLPDEFNFKSNLNPAVDMYHAVKTKDGYVVKSKDGYGPWHFYEPEMHRYLIKGVFEIIGGVTEKSIYVIEYGSSYDSDPWEIIGYCNTKEEAQEFINKQFSTSLYHCTKVKHVSKIKE